MNSKDNMINKEICLGLSEICMMLSEITKDNKMSKDFIKKSNVFLNIYKLNDVEQPKSEPLGCGEVFEMDLVHKDGSKDKLVCRCGEDDGLCDKCESQNKSEVVGVVDNLNDERVATLVKQNESELDDIGQHIENLPIFKEKVGCGRLLELLENSNKRNGVEVKCGIDGNFCLECDRKNAQDLKSEKKGCGKETGRVYYEKNAFCGDEIFGKEDIELCDDCQKDLKSVIETNPDKMSNDELESEIKEHSEGIAEECRKAQLNDKGEKE